MRKAIIDLVPGDMVDLRADKFADKDSSHPEFSFEYEIVALVEKETDSCWLVAFESGFACGFPPFHAVPVES